MPSALLYRALVNFGISVTRLNPIHRKTIMVEIKMAYQMRRYTRKNDGNSGFPKTVGDSPLSKFIQGTCLPPEQLRPAIRLSVQDGGMGQ